jgi:hypothetical protein
MVPILLEGRWVYTIQGLMQWTNPDNLTVDPSNKLEWGWAFRDDPNHKDLHVKTEFDFTPIPLTVVPGLYPYVNVPVDANGKKLNPVPLGTRPDLPPKDGPWWQTIPGHPTTQLAHIHAAPEPLP